jgi:hypothetical protein
MPVVREIILSVTIKILLVREKLAGNRELLLLFILHKYINTIYYLYDFNFILILFNILKIF